MLGFAYPVVHIVLHTLMATIAIVLSIMVYLLYKTVKMLTDLHKSELRLDVSIKSPDLVNCRESTTALYAPLLGVSETDEYELSDEFAAKVTDYQYRLIKGEILEVYTHLFVEFQRGRGFYRWDDRDISGKISISIPRVTAYIKAKVLKEHYDGSTKN